MNSIVGKSTGIALLMAAALLAALFAMGVFSATGVGAEVRTTPAPTATLSTNIPGSDDVTLTVTFELSQPVDGTTQGANVVIGIPSTVTNSMTTDFLTRPTDPGTISVTQNGVEVGSVTTADDEVTIIQATEDSENGRVEAGVLTTVTISPLTLVDSTATGDVEITQQANQRDVTIGVHPSVTSASFELSDTTTGATDVTATLKFTTDTDADGTNTVTITLPLSYDVVDDQNDIAPAGRVEPAPTTQADAVDDETGDTLVYGLDSGITADTEFRVTITGLTNPMTDMTFTATFEQAGQVDDVEESVDVALISEYKATAATEPGSNQSLRVRGRVEYADSDNITVNLAKFGVPSSIDADQVNVNVNGDDANPTDVEIDGTKVTLVAPFEVDVEDAPDTKLEADDSDLTTITFRRSAGITLPTLHGLYDIKVSTSESPEGTAEAEKEEGGDKVKTTVDVQRQVKVSPTSGTRGTEITITGKGFADGSATLRIDDSVRTGSLDIADGAFTYTVLTDVTNSSGNNVFDTGPNDITVNDSQGKTAAAAVHTVKASFSISPEEISPGEKVVISLIDAPEDKKPTTVRFAGDTTTEVTGTDIGNADDALDTTWDVTVPDLGRTGTLEMRVVVADIDDLTKNVMVATKDLTLSPSTAVAGQDITIQGSGFSGSGEGDTSITIDGGDPLDGTDDITVDSGGSMSVTITLPESATAGDRRIQFQDTVGRIGRATLTIPKATLSVSPEEGLIGSAITVSGEGFPANDLVQITYAEGPGASAANRPIGTATTGPTGVFETTVRVPSFALTGESHKVAATSQLARDEGNRVSASSKHSTPDPDVTFSPSQVVAGGRVTISGSNFTGFIAVESVTIGTVSVLPVPGPSTDGNGSFTANNVLVPQLDPGNYTVKITVGDDVVTKFLAIVVAVEAPASSDPADVFGGLGDRLVRVWYLERSTQVWSFYDPDPDVAAFNTLTEVNSGQNVSIIISPGANIGFQDMTLYPGTNPIALK